MSRKLEIKQIYKVASNNWFHITRRRFLNKIKSEGLSPGKNVGFGFTQAALEQFYKYYDIWPIFISKEPWLTKKEVEDNELVVLSIDITGLKLTTDLPSLIDHMAYVSDYDEGIIYWGSDLPKELEGFDSDGEFFINDFLKDEDLIKAAIKLTGTAAVMSNIPPDKIKVIE